MFFEEKKEKIAYYLALFIKLGVFFILFLPMVMNSEFFFPFVVPKNIFFRIAVEIIFASYLLLIYFKPEFFPRFNNVVWAVLAFFGFTFISTFSGISVYLSFWGNYERMGGFFHYLHLLAYFLVLVNIIRKRQDWHLFLSFSIFISTLMSFLAYAQWLEIPFLLQSSGGTRLSATIGNPTYLAAYLIFNLFFIIYFLLKQKDFKINLYFYGFLFFDALLIFGGILAKFFASMDFGSLNFLKISLIKDSLSYPMLFFIFLLFQVLISLVWFFRFKKYSISTLLWVIFIFQLWIFLNTKTRGAILGFLVAATFFSFVLYFYHSKKMQKIVYGLFGIFLFLFQLFAYKYGELTALSLGKNNLKFISDFGVVLKRISGQTALIGFYLSLLAVCFVGIYFLKNKNKKIIVSLLLFFLLFSPAFLIFSKNSSFVKDSQTLSQFADFSKIEDITTQSRLLTWEASWNGWIENPKAFLVGYGPENYYYVFNKYFPVEIYKDAGSQIWFDRPHNIIFDVATTTGFFGLVCYLAILFFVIFNLINFYYKNKSISKTWLLISLLIAYFIQNLFVFDTLNTEILFFLLLALICFETNFKKNENDARKTYSLKNFSFVYPIISAVIIFFGLVVNINTAKANLLLVDAIHPTKISKHCSEKIDCFQLAIDQSIVGRFEARQQLASYSINILADKNISDALKINAINYATSELEKSVSEEPLNVRHYIFLSGLYNATAQINKANIQKSINLMTKAIELSPARPHIYYDLGRSYIYAGDFDNSLKYFQKGVNLAPKVIDGHWNILTTYIIFDKDDLFKGYFQKMQKELDWKLSVNDYKKLVGLFQIKQNYDKMIEMQLEVVKLEPNFENYKNLIILYAKAKKTGEARSVIDEVKKINKAAGDELEKILTELK